MDQLDLDRELDALYAAISGRRFSYDPYSDPLYRSYAARYVQNGRMAMRDTMGQAAALTGGYASSYGQAVGQQQYDEYLRALSEAMPELYQMAYQRYSAEGEALRGAYDMANARRESDYARERDAAADAAARDERDYKRRQDAYARLYQLILGSGYDPSDEELEAAGLSRAQADALLGEYERKNAPRGGGSGGHSSGRRRSSSGKSGSTGGGESSGGSSGGRGPGLYKPMPSNMLM